MYQSEIHSNVLLRLSLLFTMIFAVACGGSTSKTTADAADVSTAEDVISIDLRDAAKPDAVLADGGSEDSATTDASTNDQQVDGSSEDALPIDVSDQTSADVADSGGPDDTLTDILDDDSSDTNVAQDIAQSDVGDSQSGDQTDSVDSSPDTVEPLGCARFVKPGGTGDGMSWATAQGGLQEAIESAEKSVNGTTVKRCTVYLMSGTYYNTLKFPIAYVLASKVDVRGGYLGQGPGLGTRDPKQHQTILSACDTANCSFRGDTIIQAKDGIRVLDGLIFRDANGGALVTSDGGYTRVNQCWFVDNPGGGIRTTIGHNSGQLWVTDSTFLNNTAVRGAAILADSARFKLSGSLFVGNHATLDGSNNHGGALYIAASFVEVTDSVFAANLALGSGGAIFVRSSGTVGLYKNLVFVGNQASFGGGLILFDTFHAQGTNTPVINCTFGHNRATEKGDSIFVDAKGQLDMINTVSLSKIEADVKVKAADMIFSHSAFPGATGDSNIATITPGFPENIDTGLQWSDPKFDPKTFTTTVKLSGASFKPGSLAGRFASMSLVLVAGDHRLAYPIVSNGLNTLTIHGRVDDASKNRYVIIYGVRPLSTSLLIDAGDDTQNVTVDVLGSTRLDVKDKGLLEVMTDIGAYEYLP